MERQIEKLSSAPLAAGLYLVATPIGHLGDITLRALFTLAAADVVLCEDTRHSRKLFSAYGIGRKLETYHDFSGEKDRARVLAALAEGKSVALISDAGTPLIADPGYKLVRAAIAEGFQRLSRPWRISAPRRARRQRPAHGSGLFRRLPAPEGDGEAGCA